MSIEPSRAACSSVCSAEAAVSILLQLAQVKLASDQSRRAEALHRGTKVPG